MRLVMCDANVKIIFHIPPKTSKILHKKLSTPLFAPFFWAHPASRALHHRRRTPVVMPGLTGRCMRHAVHRRSAWALALGAAGTVWCCEPSPQTNRGCCTRPTRSPRSATCHHRWRALSVMPGPDRASDVCGAPSMGGAVFLGKRCGTLSIPQRPDGRKPLQRTHLIDSCL